MTGPELREARKKLGWRVMDLAAAAGVCDRTISTWENGKRKPHPQTLRAVVEVMGDPTLYGIEPKNEWPQCANVSKRHHRRVEHRCAFRAVVGDLCTFHHGRAVGR